MTSYFLKSSPAHPMRTTRYRGGVRVDGHDVPLRDLCAGLIVAQGAGGPLRAHVAAHGDTVHVHLNGRVGIIERVDPTRSRGAAGPEAGGAHAPMPGVVVSWLSQPGASVTRGDALLVIESMKLQMTIEADRDGILEDIPYQPGQTFQRGATLARIRDHQAEGASA